MLKFNITSAVQRELLRMISDNGEVDLVIKRVSNDEFVMSGLYKGQEILEMPNATVPVGGTFEIKGVRIKIDSVVS